VTGVQTCALPISPGFSWRRGRRTGGLQRALRYLATHRPASLNAVARAVGTDVHVLTRNRAFRRAWAAYARRGPVSGRSRSHFGRPRCARVGR
jgi:hypothetical protein